MDSINSLISDLELDKSLIDCLKNRDLEQKFFYTEEGADLYYGSYDHSAKSVPVDFSSPEYYDLITKELKKKQRIAL
ncbi:MAG TPA: hypothetical protein PLQ46_01295, partial [bacterium]|nr:hypothetical protein [bacterium]